MIQLNFKSISMQHLLMKIQQLYNQPSRKDFNKTYSITVVMIPLSILLSSITMVLFTGYNCVMIRNAKIINAIFNSIIQNTNKYLMRNISLTLVISIFYSLIIKTTK